MLESSSKLNCTHVHTHIALISHRLLQHCNFANNVRSVGNLCVIEFDLPVEFCPAKRPVSRSSFSLKREVVTSENPRYRWCAFARLFTSAWIFNSPTQWPRRQTAVFNQNTKPLLKSCFFAFVFDQTKGIFGAMNFILNNRRIFLFPKMCTYLMRRIQLVILERICKWSAFFWFVSCWVPYFWR